MNILIKNKNDMIKEEKFSLSFPKENNTKYFYEYCKTILFIELYTDLKVRDEISINNIKEFCNSIPDSLLFDIENHKHNNDIRNIEPIKQYLYIFLGRMGFDFQTLEKHCNQLILFIRSTNKKEK